MSLPVRSVFYMPRHSECPQFMNTDRPAPNTPTAGAPGAAQTTSMPQAHSNPSGKVPSSPPVLRPIQSRHNALVKQLRQAFSQASPAEDGSVAIEGAKLVEEAIRSGRQLRAVFFAESALGVHTQPVSGLVGQKGRAEGLLALLGRSLGPQAGSGAPTEAVLLPDDVFHSAVASQSPQGVAALVFPLTATLEDLFATRPHEAEGAPLLPSARRSGNAAPLLLGCAGLQDPGNFGAILRSAEAFGASGVMATEGTVSTANPKVARASAGSVFRLPVVRLSTKEAIAALREHNVRLAVASSHQGRPAHEIDLSLPTAIFIGNEGQGVPRALADAADEVILIPHSPQVESLNAAIAASILLYEAQRQRSR